MVKHVTRPTAKGLIAMVDYVLSIKLVRHTAPVVPMAGKAPTAKQRFAQLITVMYMVCVTLVREIPSVNARRGGRASAVTSKSVKQESVCTVECASRWEISQPAPVKMVTQETNVSMTRVTAEPAIQEPAS